MNEGMIGRAFGMLARATIQKTNDKPKIQELDVNLLGGETKTQVEYFGHYGFKSVPPAPSKGSNGVMEFATAVVAFLGGNRSHGVVIAVDDPRSRPKDWKPGESGHYDDQGQIAMLSRDGVRINGGTKNLPVQIQVGEAMHTFDKDFYEVVRGNATWRVEDGKITATVGGVSNYFMADGAHLGGMGGSLVRTVAGTATKVFAT